jgi:hypothetical protein
MRQTNQPVHPNIQWMTTFKRVVLLDGFWRQSHSSAPQQKTIRFSKRESNVPKLPKTYSK